MGKLDLFLDRRSIRKFSVQPVDKKDIEQVLMAAMYAPSAVNRQPWHFVVVDDRSLLDRIMEIHPHAAMLGTAPVAVVVCGDETLQHADGYWVVDCGAATQNLLLAAHALGLGSCWVGLHPREQRKASMAALLDLPGHVKPFALVALGHPAEKKTRPDRFHPGKVRHNRWKTAWYSA